MDTPVRDSPDKTCGRAHRGGDPKALQPDQMLLRHGHRDELL